MSNIKSARRLRLRIEQLEPRAMLSASWLWEDNLGSAPIVQVRLQAVDSGGAPLQQVRVGEQFFLQALVKDLRPAGDAKGIFSSYIDVFFNPLLASLPEGKLSKDYFSGVYVNAKEGVASPGQIQEAGAFAGFGSLEGTGAILLLDADERLLWSVGLTATQAGLAQFVVDLADQVGHEQLIFMSDTQVPGNRVQLIDAALQILTAEGDVPAQNDFPVPIPDGEGPAAHRDPAPPAVEVPVEMPVDPPPPFVPPIDESPPVDPATPALLPFDPPAEQLPSDGDRPLPPPELNPGQVDPGSQIPIDVGTIGEVAAPVIDEPAQPIDPGFDVKEVPVFAGDVTTVWYDVDVLPVDAGFSMADARLTAATPDVSFAIASHALPPAAPSIEQAAAARADFDFAGSLHRVDPPSPIAQRFDVKMGTGSEQSGDFLARNAGREVPVPLFNTLLPVLPTSTARPVPHAQPTATADAAANLDGPELVPRRRAPKLNVGGN